MSRRLAHLLAAGLIGIAATACGSTDTAPDATALPDVAEFDASLAAALNNSIDVGAWRMTSFVAQTLQIEALGADTVGVMDLDNPSVVAEFDSAGSSHQVMNLNSVFAPMFAANPAAGDPGQIDLEIWSTPGLMVIDTTDYSVIEDMNPGQLGVFSPGIFSVDMTRVGDVGGEDLAKALIGNSVAGIAEMAAGLLDKLNAPEAQDGDGNTFVGTMTFGELLEVQGTSARDAANGAASGVAGAMGVDGQLLADYYTDFYESTELDVIVTIGPSGVLESVSYKADLSELYDGLGEVLMSSPAFSDMTSADADEMSAAFSEAVYVFEAKTVYEPDESIVVEVPAGDHEDRTEAMLSFFEQSGIDFSS